MALDNMNPPPWEAEADRPWHLIADRALDAPASTPPGCCCVPNAPKLDPPCGVCRCCTDPFRDASSGLVLDVNGIEIAAVRSLASGFRGLAPILGRTLPDVSR